MPNLMAVSQTVRRGMGVSKTSRDIGRKLRIFPTRPPFNATAEKVSLGIVKRRLGSKS